MLCFLLADFDKVFVRNKVTKELAGFRAGINGKCGALPRQQGWLIPGAQPEGIKLGEPLGNKNILKLSPVAKGTTCSPTFKCHSPDYVSFTIPSLSKATKG